MEKGANGSRDICLSTMAPKWSSELLILKKNLQTTTTTKLDQKVERLFFKIYFYPTRRDEFPMKESNAAEEGNESRTHPANISREGELSS